MGQRARNRMESVARVVWVSALFNNDLKNLRKRLYFWDKKLGTFIIKIIWIDVACINKDMPYFYTYMEYLDMILVYGYTNK